MRPPEFTGGNVSESTEDVSAVTKKIASMRPPEFTGGNVDILSASTICVCTISFNEAAGIHRRKPPDVAHWTRTSATKLCFNEAAGIHRRKRRLNRVEEADRRSSVLQ